MNEEEMIKAVCKRVWRVEIDYEENADDNLAALTRIKLRANSKGEIRKIKAKKSGEIGYTRFNSKIQPATYPGEDNSLIISFFTGDSSKKVHRGTLTFFLDVEKFNPDPAVFNEPVEQDLLAATNNESNKLPKFTYSFVKVSPLGDLDATGLPDHHDKGGGVGR